MGKVKHKRKLSLFMLISLICSLALFSSCAEKHPRGYNDDLVSPEWYSEKMGVKTPYWWTEEYKVNSGKDPWTMYGYPVVITVEEMVERSAVVIRGRVLGFDFLSIEKAGGGATMAHTDYYVEVLEVLRGEPYNSELVTVRSMGGEDDKEILEVEGAELIVGNEYFLFLWMPATTGTWFYTEGDYYAVVEVNTSIFEGSEETAENAEGMIVPKTFTATMPTQLNYEPIEYHDLVEQIWKYNELYPVNEDYYDEQYINGLKNNLASGFITQEEYDRAMEGLREYGTVLYYTEPQ